MARKNDCRKTQARKETTGLCECASFWSAPVLWRFRRGQQCGAAKAAEDSRTPKRKRWGALLKTVWVLFRGLEIPALLCPFFICLWHDAISKNEIDYEEREGRESAIFRSPSPLIFASFVSFVVTSSLAVYFHETV